MCPNTKNSQQSRPSSAHLKHSMKNWDRLLLLAVCCWRRSSGWCPCTEGSCVKQEWTGPQKQVTTEQMDTHTGL